MREAAVPGYRLSKARHSTRVLVSLGLLGLFLGLLCATILTIAKTGISPSKVSAYYLGTEAGSGVDNLMAASTPRPFLELAEVTHLHLMGGSILLFLLCHLLALCDLRDSIRTTLYIVSFSSFLLTFLTPWLVIYAVPGFAWLFGPSVVTLLVTLFVLTAIPLREMWLKTS